MEEKSENRQLVEEILKDFSKPATPVNISSTPVEVSTEFIKLNKDVSKFLGISQKTWQEWKKDADFPVVETTVGWDKKGLLAYKLIKRGKDNRRHGVMISEGKQRKLEIECKILNAKYKKTMGELIEWTTHIEEMAELLGMVRIALDFMVGEVELIKNEQLLKIAESIRDKTILRLKERIENKNESSSESSSSESSESSRSSS